MSNGRQKLVALLLIVLALGAGVVSVLYFTQTSADLPSVLSGGKKTYQTKLEKKCARLEQAAKGNPKAAPLPSYCHSERKYTKRGVAALIVALLLLLGAYYASGLRGRRAGDSEGEPSGAPAP